MIVIANDNVSISKLYNMISCSNGERYTLSGNTLIGPKGVMSNDIDNIDEAFGIVIGLHGGKMF